MARAACTAVHGRAGGSPATLEDAHDTAVIMATANAAMATRSHRRRHHRGNPNRARHQTTRNRYRRDGEQSRQRRTLKRA